MASIPLSAVLNALQIVAHHADKSVAEVTRKDYRRARDQGAPLPCGLTTAEKTARTLGGWKVLATQAQDAPRLMPVVPEGHRVKGVSTLLDKNGIPVAQWAKTQEDHEDRETLLARLMAELPTKIPVRKGKIRPPKLDQDQDLLAVYPMGDPHLGMLAWGQETGEDFDLEIATRVMCGAMDELTTQGPPAAKALVLSLGDFFHTDTPDNRTRRSGHHLDVDGRLPKILRAGRDILVYQIDAALRAHQEVEVWAIPGNHDDVTSVFLQLALESHYRNEPRVNVRVEASRHMHMVFGRNLIAATHGDMLKHSDLAEVMAAEWAAEWGETIHRWWYTGHLHHIQRHEKRGCVIEVFRTLAARDAYAASHGYRSGRDMSRITLHRLDGERGRATVSAEYLERAYLGSQ